MSRRELFPYVALAAELKKLGYKVAVCANDSLEHVVKSLQVFETFYAIRWPIDDLYRTPSFKKAHFVGTLLDQVGSHRRRRRRRKKRVASSRRFNKPHRHAFRTKQKSRCT